MRRQAPQVWNFEGSGNDILSEFLSQCHSLCGSSWGLLLPTLVCLYPFPVCSWDGIYLCRSYRQLHLLSHYLLPNAVSYGILCSEKASAVTSIDIDISREVQWSIKNNMGIKTGFQQASLLTTPTQSWGLPGRWYSWEADVNQMPFAISLTENNVRKQEE